MSIMKARHHSNLDMDRSVSDVESATKINLEEEVAMTQPRSSYQAQSLPRFLFKIGSDFIFYAGAWCVALWVLYLFSQLVHNNTVAKEMRSSWNHLVEDAASNSSLVAAYIDTIEMPHLPSFTYESLVDQPLQVSSFSEQPELPLPPLPQSPRATTAMQATSPSTPQEGLPNPSHPDPSTASYSHQSKPPVEGVEGVVKGTGGSKADRDPNEAYCRDIHRKYQVHPGSSWGLLSKSQQADWMKNRCDKYFCEPHKLEGRGVYKCQPLPQ